MIDNLRPYTTMKNSGVPWLGEAPVDWEVLPNRAVFTEIKERGHPGADMLSVTIAKGVIRQRALLADSSKKDSSNQDKSAYKLVRPGDIAYNKMRAWQGAVGISEYLGIVSPAYVVQRPRQNADPRYLHYLLRTPAFAKEAERWSYGITSDMWSLRPEHFKMIYSCLPPLPEQAAIVRFLDHADRRIRRAIRAKQKLIKLLEEQKQAIIHRAVTRGLDPNVRLKPSCVEWLGDVPEHWKSTRLKFVAPKIVDCLHATPVYSNEGAYPAIRTADMRPGELLLNAARHVDEEHYRQWTARMTPSDGDILYTREGERFGVAALVPSVVQLCISQRMMVFRIHPNHNSAYIMWQINCQHVYGQAAADLIGAAAPHVNVARIKNFDLTLPPRAEQDAIVAAIEASTERPNTIIQKAREEIALLREFRTRLIADVVTGKLDVREAAARLPEEPDERLALSDIPDVSTDAEEELGDLDLAAVDEEADA
ncbi:MAG: restriction endonuclease subunit S [Rhodanobacteraceae bacterium]